LDKRHPVVVEPSFPHPDHLPFDGEGTARPDSRSFQGDETTAVPSLKTGFATRLARKKWAFNGNLRVVREGSWVIS